MNPDETTNVSELNPEKETQVIVRIPVADESDVPLFLRNSSASQKGDAQDEKDKTEE